MLNVGIIRVGTFEIPEEFCSWRKQSRNARQKLRSNRATAPINTRSSHEVMSSRMSVHPLDCCAFGQNRRKNPSVEIDWRGLDEPE